jgi:hypothetical protein
MVLLTKRGSKFTTKKFNTIGCWAEYSTLDVGLNVNVADRYCHITKTA